MAGSLLIVHTMCEGQVAEQCAYAQKLTSVLNVIVEESGGVAAGEGMDVYRQKLQTVYFVIRALSLSAVGLGALPAAWLRAVGMHEFPSECMTRSFLSFWAESAWTTAIAPDDEPRRRMLSAFGFCAHCFHCCAQPDANKQWMLSVLSGTAGDWPGGLEALTATAACCRETYCWAVWNILAFAARMAERLGAHELAEQYAQRCLARGGHELIMSQMHALLGRAAATRQRDRTAAVAHWREAASIAMDACWHLYALCVGCQCGAQEGRAIADAACDKMGRPLRVVLGELEDAGAVFQGGETASAWAHSWVNDTAAAGAGNAGAAASGPSTPRRKLQEARALDAALVP